ncbi:siroheme synthase [Pisolithus albus]|nr:siroheme synthase [Pisolithus albus]
MSPSVLGGASLLVAWQLKDKHVLIVGGGDVASGRIESVLAADARLTIISPSSGLHPLTKLFIEGPYPITYHDRTFGGVQDLSGVDMVLTAIDDVAQSRTICALCRDLRIPVNVADIPDSCDFFFGSQIRDGPLQIMVSTNGQSPKLANIIKRKIEKQLPEHAGDAIANVGRLRTKRRMKWMVDVCNSWDFQDLAQLNEQTMKKLLDAGWENGTVPEPADLGVRRKWPTSVFTAISAAVPVMTIVAGATCACMLLFSRFPRSR